MIRKKANNNDSGAITSLLGPGSNFKGRITFQGNVRIECHFEGEILSKGTLYIGRGGEVKAKIKVRNVVIDGRATGDIEADEVVEILPSGVVNGNLKASVLIVADGAILNGECRMEDGIKEGGGNKPPTIGGSTRGD
jgi:cytoskeletal protein CcmA (bactofilin family)